MTFTTISFYWNSDFWQIKCQVLTIFENCWELAKIFKLANSIFMKFENVSQHFENFQHITGNSTLKQYLCYLTIFYCTVFLRQKLQFDIRFWQKDTSDLEEKQINLTVLDAPNSLFSAFLPTFSFQQSPPHCSDLKKIRTKLENQLFSLLFRH